MKINTIEISLQQHHYCTKIKITKKIKKNLHKCKKVKNMNEMHA